MKNVGISDSPEDLSTQNICVPHGLAHPCEACAVESSHEQALADHNRLVRELDVLLNGEAGAARQASLCDIVGQVRREGITADESAPEKMAKRIALLALSDTTSDLRVNQGVRLACAQLADAIRGLRVSLRPAPWR